MKAIVIMERLFGHPFYGGAWILVEPSVLKVIDPFRQRSLDAPEAGGILLGYRRETHLHVVEATVPGPADRRTRTFFGRDDSIHRKRAITQWRNSNRYMDYLGEWHTHPERSPSPSATDRRAWSEITARRSHDSYVFIILGTREGIWAGCGLGGSLRVLNEAAS